MRKWMDWVRQQGFEKWVTVYETTEDFVGEAQEWYWAIKGNGYEVEMSIPYNMENWVCWGYKKSTVYIKVKESDRESVKAYMRDTRVEFRAMERRLGI